MKKIQVLNLRIDSVSYQSVVDRIREWALAGESRYVCAANVHMTMEAYDSADFRAVVNQADMVVPDGMPLVWSMRLLGVNRQGRVYGPDLTLRVCGMAAEHNIPVALYGGTVESLAAFERALINRFPGLDISCAISPPFRPLSNTEMRSYLKAINRSGARIVLVGLGCPKQEYWMSQHQHQIGGVMLGVGAAFDFHSGRVKQAPSWMQKSGMEWFFRLLMEPRRLWKRYLKHNPRFVFLFLLQLLGVRRFQEVKK